MVKSKGKITGKGDKSSKQLTRQVDAEINGRSSNPVRTSKQLKGKKRKLDALDESNITPDESEKVGEMPKRVKARSKTQLKSLAKVHKGDKNPGSSKEKSKTL